MLTQLIYVFQLTVSEMKTEIMCRILATGRHDKLSQSVPGDACKSEIEQRCVHTTQWASDSAV